MQRRLTDGRIVTVHRTGDGLSKRCTCRRREWSRCPHPWHYAIQVRGHDYRMSLTVEATCAGREAPTTKREAKAEAAALKAAIIAGTFRQGKPDAAPRLTFGEVVAHYLRDHVLTPTRRGNPLRQMQCHLAVLLRAPIPAGDGRLIPLAEKPVASITPADVRAVVAHRRAVIASGSERSRPGSKGGECGINRLLARLRHIFSWAMDNNYCDVTPFRHEQRTVIKLNLKGIEDGRTRRLDGDERDRLLAVAPPYLHALIVALLDTGCRPGELYALRWADVQGGRITIPASVAKTGTSRVIPIGRRLRAILDLQRAGLDGIDPEAWLFTDPAGRPLTTQRVHHAWREICQRAGISGLQLRDLRRSFASELLEAGGPISVVQAFLGHANISMTSRYLRSSPEAQTRALDQLDAARQARERERDEAEPMAALSVH